ncbi:MAG: protein phosphatase 2C domain-containing protein [Treponema sp.]|nr:protein phosphatase 2C domain-containing protein [Treponema sp.]
MWKALGCAVQGNGHLANNIPCQDKVASLSRNGVSVIALADGAGSAKLSHFGAERVTQLVCEKLCSNFDYMFADDSDGINAKNSLLTEINSMLEKLSAKHDCTVKDLSSTLLAVAVKGDEVLAVHLGDGVVGCLKNDELKVISKPDNGDYANLTVFTTSERATSSIKLIKGQLKDKQGFVLMSDGSCASLYNKQTNELSSGIRSIMKECDKCRSAALNEQLIESFKYDVRAKTNDDCSIAILYNDENIFPGYKNLGYQRKRKILCVNECNRIYKDEDKILRYISENGKSLLSIMYYFHKKPKRIKKALDRLIYLNLIYEKEKVFLPVIKITSDDDNFLKLQSLDGESDS